MKKCTECYPILGSLTKPHLASSCPLKKAYYCGLCAKYGHSPAMCTQTTGMLYREPQFVEQLVAPSLLAEYQIDTCTPITGVPFPTHPERTIMEVPETEEALRAALTSFGVKPMICQEKGRREQKELTENKKKLQKIADKMGRNLIFTGGKKVAKK